MSAPEDSEPFEIECDPGKHEWMCLTVQHGVILGVDSSGAPVFLPNETSGTELDEPTQAEVAYGCSICSVPWNESFAASSI